MPLFQHMGRQSDDSRLFQKKPPERPQPGLFERVKNFITGMEDVPGLRPQDDESMRLLIRNLKGEGMGANAEALRGLGITPQAIVQAALRAPGYTPVEVRPQRRGLDFLNPWALNEPGTQGTTPITREGMKKEGIRVYPEQQRPEQMPNTMLHELIHGMRVNKELNTQGPDIEETLGYYGSGTPLGPSFRGNNVDISRQPEVNQKLQDLLRYQE